MSYISNLQSSEMHINFNRRELTMLLTFTCHRVQPASLETHIILLLSPINSFIPFLSGLKKKMHLVRFILIINFNV